MPYAAIGAVLSAEAIIPTFGFIESTDKTVLWEEKSWVSMRDRLRIICKNGGNEEEAKNLAQRLEIPLDGSNAKPASDQLVLYFEESGVSLHCGRMSLKGDYEKLLPRLRPDKLSKELLLQAARIRKDKNPSAVDATAGMGEDALLLAASGFEVTLFESDPVIAALLKDTIRRARLQPRLTEIADRMHLFEQDSIKALPNLSSMVDIVYLDPMFPARKKSALVKKKLQLLQHLEQPCEDEESLLAAASQAHPQKIIVKRPPKGPYLAGRKPDYSFMGKAVRFDCLLMRVNEM